MSGFTNRMRADAPRRDMTLLEMCEHAGVSSSILRSTNFSAVIDKMCSLGILSSRLVDAKMFYDEEPQPTEVVRLAHPNLWEEVVGNLKYAESLTCVTKAYAITSSAKTVSVFGPSSWDMDVGRLDKLRQNA